MSEQTKGEAVRRPRRWNWAPEDPIRGNPLFYWPLQPLKILQWIGGTWTPTSVRPWVLLITFFTWYFIQPSMERCREFEIGWILEIWARNMVLMTLVAGGLHLYLYRFKGQGDKRRFDSKPMVEKGRGFIRGNQVFDNIVWTLGSGVTVWTFFEVITFWAYANDLLPTMVWADNPIWFIALFMLQPIWGSFHFYVIHRALHWPPLYRLAHAVHHNNINIGPWSGMSMHPIEHLLYLSSAMIHWVVASHPIHFLYHMQIKALEASTSHSGYHSVVFGDKPRFSLGDYFHQLHHRHFECNYGTLEMPWDRFFGTFHDGTEAGDDWMRERREGLAKR